MIHVMVYSVYVTFERLLRADLRRGLTTEYEILQKFKSKYWEDKLQK